MTNHPRPSDAPKRDVWEELAQDARIIREARMLPDRALTVEEIEAVGREFDAFLRRHKVALPDVSRALGKGFSASVLSEFRNCKYKKGGAENVARAVNGWMERFARHTEVARPEGFVETEVARKILTAIKMAMDYDTIATIVGPAGTGKTMTIQAAHKLYAGSLYVRIMQSIRRGPSLSKAFCKQLGVPMRNTFEDRQLLLVEQLKGSRRPIFIDEAHQLTESGLEAVRDLHDGAGVPIILVGTIDINRMIDDTAMFYGQFSSRVLIRLDVTEQARHPKHPKPLYTHDEIASIFRGGEIRLTKDAVDFLTDLACAPGVGGLRLCRQIVTVASRLRKLKGEAINAKVLSQVCQKMHGIDRTQVIQSRVQTTRKVAVA